MADRARLSPKWMIPMVTLVSGVALVLSALDGGERRTEAAAPGSAQSIFRVSSTPGDCEVRYDGEAVGRTPLRLEREPDLQAHSVEVACEGYLPHSEVVLAEKGEQAIAIELGRPAEETVPRKVEEVVHLHVVSEPLGAQVRWDGTAKGVTPLDLEVPRDTAPHELAVLHPSLQPQRLSVTPDRDQAFTLTLNRPTTAENARLAKVVIFSRPSGARVKWDGQDVGTTPAVFQRPADDAEHDLELLLNGYPPVKLRRVLSSDLMERVELAK